MFETIKGLFRRSSTLAHPDELLRNALGGGTADSGETVNSETAKRVVAVFRAIALVSGALAKLPLEVFRRTGPGEREKRPDHHVAAIFGFEANPQQAAYQFRRQMMVHALSTGNGFARIERNGAGQAVYLWPMLPDTVQVTASDGAIIYVHKPRTGGRVVLDQDDVYHLAGMGYDGLVGYSPIAMARNAIGLAMAAEKTGGKIFAQGAIQRGVLEADKTLDDKQFENLKESWQAQYSGSENAGKTPVLEGGIKFKGISVPMADLAFIESRRFQIEEIARLYGIPPHMLGVMGASTYNNVEQQGLDFRGYTLDDWANASESEANRKLLPVRQRRTHYVEHNFDAMLRTDSAARAKHYRDLWSIAGITTNEVRKKENLPAIEDGDVAMVPANMVPLTTAAATTPPEEPPAAPAAGPGGDLDVEGGEDNAARSVVDMGLMAGLRHVCERAAAKESTRIKQAATRWLARDVDRFLATVENHQADQVAHLADQLAPLVEGRAAAIGRELPMDAQGAGQAAAMRAVKAWQAMGLGQVKDAKAADLAAWETRTGERAQDLLERCAVL